MPRSRLARRARRVWPQDAVNRDHPLNDRRQAWWCTLPELAGGTTWYDLTGQYPGALTSFGTTSQRWVGSTRPGSYGALSLDGAGYVTTNYVPPVEGAFALWYKSTYNYGYDCLFSSNGPYGWLLEYSGSVVYVTDNNTLAGHYSTFSDGRDHRYMVTMQGSVISFFIDGIYKESVTGSSSSGGSPLAIGQYFNFAANPIIGQIDDVSCWGNNSLLVANATEFAALDYDQTSRGYPDAFNWY